jgi:hypothetical protein
MSATETFWTEQADALRASLAAQGPEFVATASLEQIEALAGPDFLAQAEAARRCHFQKTTAPDNAV